MSSPELKKELQENPVRKAIDQLAEKSDINIIGASGLNREATTFKESNMEKTDYQELFNNGAIGDVAGIFIDKEGETVDWNKKECYTGLSLEEINQGKIVVCAAGGSDKKEVIQVAAKRKYFNTLITTEEVARYMLECI